MILSKESFGELQFTTESMSLKKRADEDQGVWLKSTSRCFAPHFLRVT